MRRACELLGTASNHIVGRRGISASNARHLTLPQPESALQAAAAKTSAPPVTLLLHPQFGWFGFNLVRRMESCCWARIFPEQAY
jgi:hypothetical protein